MSFQEWESQLSVLHSVYQKICQPEKVFYKKCPPATLEEVVFVEQSLGVSIPSGLRNTFLQFSKEIVFSALLPQKIAFPQELKEVFSIELYLSLEELQNAEECRKEWVKSCFSNPNDEYDKIWHNKLGFLTVPSGDVIAFDLSDPKEDKRIVYLSHEDSEIHGTVLAQSFVDYFSAFLQIGGFGNEDCELMQFLIPEKGLCPNCDNAKTYRNIIGLHL